MNYYKYKLVAVKSAAAEPLVSKAVDHWDQWLTTVTQRNFAEDWKRVDSEITPEKCAVQIFFAAVFLFGVLDLNVYDSYVASFMHHLGSVRKNSQSAPVELLLLDNWLTSL